MIMMKMIYTQSINVPKEKMICLFKLTNQEEEGRKKNKFLADNKKHSNFGDMNP